MAKAKDDSLTFWQGVAVAITILILGVGTVTTLYWTPTIAEVVFKPWLDDGIYVTASIERDCDLTLAWTTEAQKEPIHYHTVEDQRPGTTTLLSAPKSDRYVLEVQNPCGSNLRFNLKR